VKNSLQLPSGYQEFLQDLKGRIRATQVQAGFAVNRELILLYWLLVDRSGPEPSVCGRGVGRQDY
jgi:hypothetical protein